MSRTVEFHFGQDIRPFQTSSSRETLFVDCNIEFPRKKKEEEKSYLQYGVLALFAIYINTEKMDRSRRSKEMSHI